MKIALLFSLLIYQLLQYCDATVICTSLTNIMEGSTEVAYGATILTSLGATKEIYANPNFCNDPSNNNYILLQQNHHDGQLSAISRQQGRKFTLTNIQFSNTGIYCTYKRCAPREREHCCVRILVPPVIKIIFPSLVYSNTQERGVCYVESWPLAVGNSMSVTTNNHKCLITKEDHIRSDDTYSMAIIFTLDNINSSCMEIICGAHSKTERKSITIVPTPTPTSSHTSSPTTEPTPGSTSTTTAVTPTPNTANDSKIEAKGGGSSCHCSSGALGLYRITLWIIVLTLTILSTAITSLTPGIL